MLKKRIIPCLDIQDARVVKGVNFKGIQDAGDPVELAKRYEAEGADELVFLDITATLEKRKTLTDLVESIAAELSIPFTVGGGISSVEDASLLLEAGADKIAVNSAAIKRPKLIAELAGKFGSQCVVLAIDAKMEMGEWKVYKNGGRLITNWGAVDWAKKGGDLGAGEILLTSMNNDGCKGGFAIDILDEISKMVNVPVIASGGAGSKNDFVEVFQNTNVSAALAASIFHYNEVSIPSLKDSLIENKIPVRWK